MKTIGLAIAAITLSTAAHASIIPTLAGVTPDGSDFLFSYQGQLAPDQGVQAGNELVIVDFAGYVPGSVASAIPDVTASVSDTLPAGLLLPPGVVDNPAIPDLVFTYTGPNFDTSGGPFGGLTDFNGLTAESKFHNITLGTFSAVAVKNVGEATGTPAFNVGFVGIPSSIPEPATWAVILVGFGAVGVSMRARRRHVGSVA
jgi:hypothetical protein